MRKIREVLRLRLGANLPYQAIKASTKISVGACQKLVKKAEALFRSVLIHLIGIPIPISSKMVRRSLQELIR